MPRLFIATPIAPPPALTQMLQRVATLGRSVRAVNPQQLHLTYRFLGEIEDAHIPGIEEALRAGLSAAAACHAPLRGVGAFPPGDAPPRVLFVRFAEPEPLTRIAAAVDEALAPREDELPPRDQAFAPHLTLGRVKRRRKPDAAEAAALRRLLADSRDAELGTVPIDRVELIASELTPDGPIHTPRAIIPLAPTPV